MNKKLDWQFPLTRPHTGMLLGNARIGAMIWGEGSILCLTLGKADLWDHRGGMPWSAGHNFPDIRKCLESGDEPGLRKLFETTTEKTSGQPVAPSIIPLGRIELDLGEGAQLKCGELDLQTAVAQIHYTIAQKTHTLQLTMSMDDDVILLTHDNSAGLKVINRPAWETAGDALEKISFKEPVAVELGGMGGWVQEFPADPEVCVLYAPGDTEMWLGVASGADDQAAVEVAGGKIDAARNMGAQAFTDSIANWWQGWWSETPQLQLPNKKLEDLYCYGMYKFAGLAQPGGIAATLQGPWIEDYQLPPWSSDYHFNINVQMCYWPAFRGNQLASLRPLFDLIFSWEETLKDNARQFAGVDDGRMLPHAVDDRCTCMGGFWTGVIDHACTAWVAQMMYDYALYLPDMEFLREKALPFMRGTFAVFAAMLEKVDGRYSLPVSVSPEFGGSNMGAWGRDASFQLAAIHRLCENLQNAARLSGVAPDPLWQEVRDNLPLASLVKGKNNVWAKGEGKLRIAPWQGRELDESHRHHSHLGGLYPFDTLDTTDPEWAEIISESIDSWVYRGMGMWSGWSMPWASILHSRMGNGRMAEMIIEMWEKVFTNNGRGTLHNCDYNGFTLLGAVDVLPEIMQMDAGMGITGAVLEMFVQSQRGVHYLMRGVPDDWRDCSFSGIRAEGGLLIDSRRENYKTVEVCLRPLCAGSIKLANPFEGRCVAEFGDSTQEFNCDVIELTFEKDCQIVLRAL